MITSQLDDYLTTGMISSQLDDYVTTGMIMSHPEFDLDQVIPLKGLNFVLFQNDYVTTG